MTTKDKKKNKIKKALSAFSKKNKALKSTSDFNDSCADSTSAESSQSLDFSKDMSNDALNQCSILNDEEQSVTNSASTTIEDKDCNILKKLGQFSQFLHSAELEEFKKRELENLKKTAVSPIETDGIDPECFEAVKAATVAAEELKSYVEGVLEVVSDESFTMDNGDNFLELQQHLHIHYMHYLLYWILLRSTGNSVASHPVMARLVEVKFLLEKMFNVYDKIMPNILAKLNPNNDCKPRIDMMVTEEPEQEGLIDDNKKSTAYIPPKMMAVPFEDKRDKRKEKEESNDNLSIYYREGIEALKEKTQDTPIEYKEEQTFDQVSDFRTKKLLQKYAEHKQHEEENLTRLASSQKLQRKVHRHLKDRGLAALYGDTSLSDLNKFSDKIISSRANKKQKLQSKTKK